MWLDTIDLRLYRGGMALTAVAGPDGGASILELSRPDGATVTAGPDTLGWPRLLAVSPDDLRPHLEPVLGVRALLPVVEASGDVRHRQVAGRRGQDRVAAWSTNVRPPSPASRDRLPGGLWLIPLRGYDAVGAARRPDRAAGGAGSATTARATRRRCAPRGSIPTGPRAP